MTISPEINKFVRWKTLFFGFDTSVPLEDDGGGQIAEPSEEEYDALNDETFGSAINGDWEEVHENLVRLNHNSSGESQATNKSFGNGGFDSYGSQKYFSAASSAGSTPAHRSSRSRRADNDLEVNLSSMKLDDVDFDDNESCGGSMDASIEMDPSVWSSHPPGKSPLQMGNRGRNMFFGNGNSNSGNGVVNPQYMLRDNFYSPTGFQKQRMKQEVKPTRPSSELPFLFPSVITPKISTLEDIERNLIVQQKQRQEQLFLDEFVKQSQKPQQQSQQKRQQHHQQVEKLQQHQQQPLQQHQLHHQQQQQQQPQHQMQKQQQKGPPGFTSQTSPRPAANNLPQHHPHANMAPQQMPNAAGRMPPGFPMFPPGFAGHMQQPHPQIPPHPLLAQHSLPHPHQRPLPNPHLPIALNNFAMHPNFNAMRAAAAAAAIHQGVLAPPNHQGPRLPPHVMNAGPMNQTQYNMFNMRLVEEIRQNHPLLRPPLQQQQQSPGMPNHQQYHNMMQRNNGAKQVHHRRDSVTGNGNLPHEEYDDYANLMSTRDKHWLIGIQLSQLNTDTPYIDDFYYTIYRERKAAVTGSFRHSQAHKDNQLNHPLTQPRGHAQLILVQLGNKNGTRNGQHRERNNSESSSSQDQRAPYVFTPLKFENSLGKLQYGSVTAPRKIIDAEIMTADAILESVENVDVLCSHTSVKNSTVALSSSRGSMGESQRKSRHILLHIETLYRIVLKLEDLDNPHAITTIIMKKKKEAERIAALEQMENANKTAEERASESSTSMNPALKNKFAYEIETKEALVAKLISGLTHDKIVAMMNVRKGKALIKRIMAYILDNDVRWQVWIGVFSSLQNVFKKDREDAERVLYALYPDFKEQIKSANFEIIVRIAASIPFDIKKLNAIFCSKFGISSLVCLIIQAEQIYVSNCDVTFNSSNKECWRQFLDQVATTLNRTLQSQTICAAIESDSIQPMINHFARFQDLKLDSLLALIKEAKQQIN